MVSLHSYSPNDAITDPTPLRSSFMTDTIDLSCSSRVHLCCDGSLSVAITSLDPLDLSPIRSDYLMVSDMRHCISPPFLQKLYLLKGSASMFFHDPITYPTGLS